MDIYQMPGANVLAYQGRSPTFGSGCFLAAGAQLMGDLNVGSEASFWFNTVVRADCNYIRIGNRTNVQDGTVIHVTQGSGPTHIGNDVTIGHGAIIHACRIADLVLIGMGSIILDGAHIKSNSLVAAGSLVSPGKEFPDGVLIKGSPAVATRDLNDQELAYLKTSVQYYINYKNNYMATKF